MIYRLPKIDDLSDKYTVVEEKYSDPYGQSISYAIPKNEVNKETSTTPKQTYTKKTTSRIDVQELGKKLADLQQLLNTHAITQEEFDSLRSVLLEEFKNA